MTFRAPLVSPRGLVVMSPPNMHTTQRSRYLRRQRTSGVYDVATGTERVRPLTLRPRRTAPPVRLWALLPATRRDARTTWGGRRLRRRAVPGPRCCPRPPEATTSASSDRRFSPYARARARPDQDP